MSLEFPFYSTFRPRNVIQCHSYSSCLQEFFEFKLFSRICSQNAVVLLFLKKGFKSFVFVWKLQRQELKSSLSDSCFSRSSFHLFCHLHSQFDSLSTLYSRCSSRERLSPSRLSETFLLRLLCKFHDLLITILPFCCQVHGRRVHPFSTKSFKYFFVQICHDSSFFPRELSSHFRERAYTQEHWDIWEWKTSKWTSCWDFMRDFDWPQSHCMEGESPERLMLDCMKRWDNRDRYDTCFLR